MADKSKVKTETGRMFEHLSRIMLRMLPFVPGPELYDLVKGLGKSRTDFDEKISRAQVSLTETSELIAELESGLNDRVNKIERLKQEYEKYSQLAEVEESKAKVIVQQIESAIGRNRGRERIIALSLNLLAAIIVFVLGVVIGPLLTQWIGLGGQ